VVRRDPALKLFRLFGLPTRLVVFQRVARHPQTATELAKEMSIGRSAIVQHLAALKEAGLVDVASDGRRRIYRAHRAGLAPLAAWLERYGGTLPLG
jgi:DNA-binding transcriptional ArsR family regulator